MTIEMNNETNKAEMKVCKVCFSDCKELYRKTASGRKTMCAKCLLKGASPSSAKEVA